MQQPGHTTTVVVNQHVMGYYPQVEDQGYAYSQGQPQTVVQQPGHTTTVVGYYPQVELQGYAYSPGQPQTVVQQPGHTTTVVGYYPQVEGQGYAYSQGQPQTVVQQPGHTTTVVVNQQIIQQPKTWSTGMCACFDDCTVCLCVTFCGMCAACQLAQEIDEFVCLAFCVPDWLTPVRTKVRTQLGIQGSICDDCMMSTCCGPCTMCQVWREVKMAKAAGRYTVPASR